MKKKKKILFNAPIDLFDSFQDGRVNSFAYPRTSLRACSRVTRGLKLPRMDGGDFVEEKILLLRLDGFFFSFFFFKGLLKNFPARSVYSARVSIRSKDELTKEQPRSEIMRRVRTRQFAAGSRTLIQKREREREKRGRRERERESEE